MNADILVTLCGQLALLSLVAIGGAHTVLPDVHRLVVREHAWLTDTQFGSLIALSQAAPGPNVLVMTLIGYQVAGFAGAIGATLAFLIPSSIVVLAAAQSIARAGDARWVRILKTGLGPLTAGLVLASGSVLARGVLTHLAEGQAMIAAAIMLVVTAGAVFTRINPLWLILAAGGAGVVLF